MMHLTVHITPHAVTLEKCSTFQSPICLTSKAWQTLLCLKAALETAENGQFCFTEGEWQLDESIIIQVPASKKHLRIYTANESMILDFEEYRYLVKHAVMQKELILGIQVTKDMITTHIADLKKKETIVHYKTVHESMKAPKLFAEEHFSSGIPTAIKFIRKLAEEADRNSFIIEQPHDTYKTIIAAHIQTIKQEVLNTFSTFSYVYL